MKRYLMVVLFILIASSFSMLIASDNENEVTTLYIEGLEALAAEDDTAAVTSFSRIIDSYPRSSYFDRAEAYLDEIQNQVDNTGIVPFYLRNLATTTYTAMMLPTLFDIEEGALTYGITGLAGVGLGLAGSAAMATDYPITSGLSWWITSSQLISLGNYLYLNGIIDIYDIFDDYEVADDVFLSGQLLTLNASLYGSYFALRDRQVSEGKGSFALQSYLWANVYYWMGVLISEEFEVKRNSAWGMGLTDLAFLGSLSLWESIRWTPMRTGLVTVGGLGGALIGWFSTMILDEFITIDTPEAFSIVMGSTVAGQATAVWLTRGLPEEHSGSAVAYQNDLTIYPIFTADGDAGVGLLCSL